MLLLLLSATFFCFSVYFFCYFYLLFFFFFLATPNRSQVGEQHFNFGFSICLPTVCVVASRISVHQVAISNAIAIASVVAVAFAAFVFVATVNHRGAHNSGFQLDFAAAHLDQVALVAHVAHVAHLAVML